MLVVISDVCTKRACDLRVPAYGPNASRPGWLGASGGLSRSRPHCVCSSGGPAGRRGNARASCIHLSVEA